MKLRRGVSLRRGLLAAVAAAALAAGGAAADAKTFKWAFQGDVQTMDPHGLFETFTLGFQSNFYEGLVTRTPDLELIPALATSWENIKPDTWRFTLRKGVKFHNGNDFNADDVIFSVERINTEGSDLKVTAALIKEAVKVDDYTVDIVTPAPDPILPLQLEIFYIMDKEWAAEHNTTAATNVKGDDQGNHANINVNGTGPFMVTERQPDVKTMLVPNPNWWGQNQSNVTEAIFTPISQDATRVAALISGDVHMAYPIPVQDWRRLDDATGVSPLTGPESRTIFLGFDQDRDELLASSVKGKNPFKDKRVRQAFYQAIDVEAIKQKVMRNSATPSNLMVAPQINGFNAAMNERLPFDVETAKALMAEAGYGDGFEVTMDCPNDRYVNDERICQAVASMLAKIGVKIDLLAQTKSKYFGKVLAQNDYDTSFYLLGWAPNSFDSHNPISSLMSCRVDGKGSFNLGGYCNERVTELADLIQVETDQEKRQALIDEAFKIHSDDVGHIPLHQQPLSWGVSDDATVAQRPDNVFRLQYVTVK
ncbi:ABC transporter substrate-binding protein [Pelagibius litoralis]|uniref:ABC transporter substrate-binding protein n=1 Tax=Pelagibius litoralis TaxID=374515 RepID=A0A967KG90_9PROT|nr:ABC transporter substrate-binding protein [Pelagibius litoralis]NIA70156.1 ABC transporter substrate-binding protein [Pelagibius litoralis]